MNNILGKPGNLDLLIFESLLRIKNSSKNIHNIWTNPSNEGQLQKIEISKKFPFNYCNTRIWVFNGNGKRIVWDDRAPPTCLKANATLISLTQETNKKPLIPIAPHLSSKYDNSIKHQILQRTITIF